jgi:hypothetical protein
MRCALLLALVTLSSCSCQRKENRDAKERMGEKAPPSRQLQRAQETISADQLTDRKNLDRVSRMEGGEIAARLQAFQMMATSEMAFSRGPEAVVKSSEKTNFMQNKNGDFSLETTTGDGSEMRLSYVNSVFFLKNNNGQWRISRDAGGEREQYRTDALSVWRAFYDLIGHALVVERDGAVTQSGRNAIRYRISLPDASAQAVETSKAVPPAELAKAVDVVDEDAAKPAAGTRVSRNDPVEQKRLSTRIAQWRKRTHPKNGKGILVVDEKTGVPLLVQFEGEAIVGDGPEPAVLHVKIDQAMASVGQESNIAAPPDAIDAVVRTKLPVEPRTVFEEAGIVEPLPPKEGEAAKPVKKAGTAAAPPTPEDED